MEQPEYEEYEYEYDDQYDDGYEYDANDEKTDSFLSKDLVVHNAAFALNYKPTLDYILEGLFSRGSVNVLYGDPGIGKTYSLLSLACCVALGKEWCGLNTQQVNCMIVDEESGETRLSIRLKAVLKSVTADGKTPIFYICLAGVKLDKPTHIGRLEYLIRSLNIGLVIFDAMSDLMDGDENDKKSVQPVMTHLRWIAEQTDAAIVLIHHSSKAGGYRGSSAIKGSCDTMTHISASHNSNKDKVLTFEVIKARDFEPGKWSAKPVWKENADGEAIFYIDSFHKWEVIPEGSKSTRKPNKYRESILEYIRENSEASLPEVIEAIDPEHPGSIKTVWYQLVHESAIIRTNNEASKGQEAFYRLATPEDIVSASSKGKLV